jgi:hypothetical protein
MIFIESKRKSIKAILKKYPAALIIDLTSQSNEPWVKFSPFYPHGNIPIPNSINQYSMSVEGIWQGLKVFKNHDIDISKFDISNMKGLKRTIQKFGYPIGHKYGTDGSEILDYLTARKKIYLPTYFWVIENKLQELIQILLEKADKTDIVFLDFETNEDIENINKPLSHASIIKNYIFQKTPNVVKMSNTTFESNIPSSKENKKIKNYNANQTMLNLD